MEDALTGTVGGVRALLAHDPAGVGPYRFIGRLGAGGMGVVYASLTAAGVRVAVKVIHPELAHDLEFRARFAREVALLGKIRGACTVRVLAADPGAYQPWFATEYVPGPTLEERVRTSGPLAGDELFGLASGLAEALVFTVDVTYDMTSLISGSSPWRGCGPALRPGGRWAS
jgi:serine/threonine protein kinase